MDIGGLLVIILIIGLALWAFQQIPLEQPIRMVAAVVLALVLITFLLGGRGLIH